MIPAPIRAGSFDPDEWHWPYGGEVGECRLVAAHPRGERVGVLLDPAGCHATVAGPDPEPPSGAYDSPGTDPGSDPGKGLSA